MKTFAAAVSFFFLLTLAGHPIHARDAVTKNPNPCDIHKGPCVQELAGMRVTLDISPKPVRAMKDLVFKVTVSGKELSPGSFPYIDLGMPGMNMGPNRVFLAPAKDGVYEGTGVFVRCPSGKRTWQATIMLPGMGEAEFIFDVVY